MLIIEFYWQSLLIRNQKEKCSLVRWNFNFTIVSILYRDTVENEICTSIWPFVFTTYTLNINNNYVKLRKFTVVNDKELSKNTKKLLLIPNNNNKYLNLMSIINVSDVNTFFMFHSWRLKIKNLHVVTI